MATNQESVIKLSVQTALLIFSLVATVGSVYVNVSERLTVLTTNYQNHETAINELKKSDEEIKRSLSALEFKCKELEYKMDPSTKFNKAN